LARGKFSAKKFGTYAPPPGVGNGAGSPKAAAGAPLAAAPSPAVTGGRAEPPVLGVVVMSPWGWRILAVAAMVAIGLCITFLLDGKTLIGALWVVIAGAWSAFTWKLWRMHLAWDAVDRRRAQAL
jgi:hypothetical protein